MARVAAAENRLRQQTGLSGLGEAAARSEARHLFAPPAEVPFIREGDGSNDVAANLEMRIRWYGSWREAKLQLLSADAERLRGA